MSTDNMDPSSVQELLMRVESHIGIGSLVLSSALAVLCAMILVRNEGVASVSVWTATSSDAMGVAARTASTTCTHVSRRLRWALV
jgi:hypothetical protein